MARGYLDERDLDELVCPPEPEPPKPEWVKQWEAEEEKRQMEEMRRREASEKRSRNFDISPGSAKGESPKEDY